MKAQPANETSDLQSLINSLKKDNYRLTAFVAEVHKALQSNDFELLVAQLKHILVTEPLSYPGDLYKAIVAGLPWDLPEPETEVRRLDSAD